MAYGDTIADILAVRKPFTGEAAAVTAKQIGVIPFAYLTYDKAFRLIPSRFTQMTRGRWYPMFLGTELTPDGNLPTLQVADRTEDRHLTLPTDVAHITPRNLAAAALAGIAQLGT